MKYKKLGGLLIVCLCLARTAMAIPFGPLEGEYDWNGKMTTDMKTPNVTTILSLDGKIVSADGDFAAYLASGTVVNVKTPWVIDGSFPLPDVSRITIAGFEITILSLTVDQSTGPSGFFHLYGDVSISGYGFLPTLGTINYLAPNPNAAGIYSVAASGIASGLDRQGEPDPVSDGGSTVALTGVSLAGLAIAVRKRKS